MANKKKKKLRASSIFYALLVLFLSAFFIVGGAGIYYVASILQDAPELDVSRFGSAESSRIYDSEGQLIVDLGEQSRENVDYEDLPQVVIDAFIAVEDSRYFEHNGFDLPRFIKAAIENLKTRNFSQGGSTITMQVVKNSYFTTKESVAEKSIPRKIKEIYLALQTERAVSKEDIFEYYINKILFGGNSYGIQKGAEYYFGKDATELTLPEAAMLAGVVNAPYSYNPYVNLSLATERRNVVLNLMLHHGHITEEECALAKSTRLEDLLSYEPVSGTTYPYQAYLDAVVEECISLTGDNPYDTQMVIYTYMDRAAQEHAENVLAGKTSAKFPANDSYFQAAFTVIENDTGHMVAIGGGRDYSGQRQFNRATSMYKQPGSTAKPILAYALAFEELGWSTTHVVEDIPIVYRGTDILLPNVDGVYLGQITLEEAISRSRNTSAMITFEQLVDELGTDYIVNHIRNLGFEVDPNEFTLGYVIGSSTFEVTPTQLASAYSTIARGGDYIKPTTIARIEYIDSDVAPIEPEYLPTTVISEQAAYLTSEMLNKCVNSPWYNYMQILKSDKFKAYAKTGTTDYGSEAEEYGIPVGAIKDKWVAAYTGDYSVAVWTGYDSPVKGAETYFTNAKNQLNIPVTIAKEMLFKLAETAETYPADVDMPEEGIDSITHVLGTYPYAISEGVAPEMLVTGLIKSEFNEVVGMAPTPVDTLQSFEADFMEETNSLVVTFAEYPDLERVKEPTGTKMYYLTYYPEEGSKIPTSYIVPTLSLGVEGAVDEEGNPIEGPSIEVPEIEGPVVEETGPQGYVFDGPLVNEAGASAVTLGVEANLIYDEKLYYGNVNYFVDVYENGELLTSYQSTDAVTAYPLPVLESNTIQVCGYYGLTVATDVVSNSICHDVIVPFSSQIESDPEWEGIWDYFN